MDGCDWKWLEILNNGQKQSIVVRNGHQKWPEGSQVIEHGQNEEKNLNVAGNEWMWLKMLCNDQK